jgi:hypothetical protein
MRRSRRRRIQRRSPGLVVEHLRRRIYYYDWSRDGTRMALASGDDTRDVVLMKGFAARP